MKKKSKIGCILEGELENIKLPNSWEILKAEKAYKRCSYTLEDLEKYDYLLIMGSTALKHLKTGYAFNKARGCLIKGNMFVTIKESDAMRDNGKKMPLLREHIKTFKKIVKGESTENNVAHTIVRTKKDIDNMLEDIAKSRAISIDTETSGLDPFVPDKFMASLGVGTKRHAWCIPLEHVNSPHKGKLKWQKRILKKVHKAIKDNQKLELVGHNGKFDTLWIYNCYGIWMDFTFDTMLAHYNLDENSQHGLKILAARYLGVDIYDIPTEDKQGYGDLEPHCLYLAQDVRYTFDLYKLFKRRLRKDKLTKRVFDKITMPVAKAYARAEQNGTWINPKALKEAKEIKQKEMDEAMEILSKYGDINWNSPKQLADLLYEQEGLPILERTKTGNPSCSESTLKRLADKHEIPKALIQYKKASKNMGTFIKRWEEDAERNGDQSIHPSFKVHGTVTGRPSCVEPNLQQVPRDPTMRCIIDAPPGWTLVEADLSQAELRVAAELSQDPELKHCYQTGIDVHTRTVETLFGIPADIMKKEERKKGKAVNFGFLYGMGYKKFKDYARDNYEVIISEREAMKTRKGFFRLYNKLPEWHKSCRRFVHKHGYVRNLVGRKRRLPEALLPDNSMNRMAIAQAERNSINSPVQSFASDINLISFIDVCNKWPDNNIVRPCGTIHDAIMFMVRDEYVDEFCRDVKYSMEHPFLFDDFNVKLSVPIVAEVEVGPWGKGKLWKDEINHLQ